MLAKVGANGQVSIFNSHGNTHLIADVVGYFSATGSAFVPTAPRRLLDTRDGTGGRTGQVGANSSFDVTLATGDPIPAQRHGGGDERDLGEQLGGVVRHGMADRVAAAARGDDEPATRRARAEPGIPEARNRRVSCRCTTSPARPISIIDAFGYFVG